MCRARVLLEVEPSQARALLELVRESLSADIEALRELAVQGYGRGRGTPAAELSAEFRDRALAVIESDGVGLYRHLLGVVSALPVEPVAEGAGDDDDESE